METDRTAITLLHESWLAAEREGRTADLIHMCCDEVVIAPPEGPAVRGRAAVDQLLRRPAAPIAEMRVDDVSIDLLGGLAVKRARFTTRMAGSAEVFRGVHVWVLRPRWKIAYITWAMDAAGKTLNDDDHMAPVVPSLLSQGEKGSGS
ncbi:MAG: nuclear transport factor 2 family protein [Brevundimonas sp.]